MWGFTNRLRPLGIRYCGSPLLMIDRDMQRLVAELLAREEADAFPWERKSAAEAAERHLKPPATNFGEARLRFSLMLQHAYPALKRGGAICDFGAFPGTFLRLARAVGGPAPRLTAVGLCFSPEFTAAMEALRAQVLSLEFDIRNPRFSGGQHVLTCDLARAGAPYDLAVCTEVIEHQMYPLSLLTGINRFLRPGGELILTTNSAGFIGDILKLAVGRHNVETLDRSHVLSDSQWRPHIRLYMLPEMKHLLALAGFEVRESFYFDFGSVYAGPRGWAIAAVRSVASIVPHMRSHMFIKAVKVSDPVPQVRQTLVETIANYNLADAIPF